MMCVCECEKKRERVCEVCVQSEFEEMLEFLTKFHKYSTVLNRVREKEKEKGQ